MKHKSIGLGALGAILLLTATVAIAAAPQAHGAATAEAAAHATGAPTAAVTGKAKLADAKLKVCQARETAITKRSTQMTDRSTKLEAKFADIATKVDTYYTTKLVPAGKTVFIYSALKSDIATKKAAVDTAVSTSKADIAGFSCTGDDPKAALTSFRTDMMSLNKALKDYRTAIKDFTKALHQAAGDSSSSTARPEVAN